MKKFLLPLLEGYNIYGDTGKPLSLWTCGHEIDVRVRSRGTGYLLSLEGTCGHEIDVRIPRDPDIAVIQRAMDASEPEALLERFCPFCMENQLFRFPLGHDQPVQTQPMMERQVMQSYSHSEPRSRYVVDFSEVVLPIEQAHRLWETARVAPESEADRAERDLRLAAQIFNRQGRFIQHGGVVEDLVKLLRKQGRHEEAETLLQEIRL
jgi:hypothetical protein